MAPQEVTGFIALPSLNNGMATEAIITRSVTKTRLVTKTRSGTKASVVIHAEATADAVSKGHERDGENVSKWVEYDFC